MANGFLRGYPRIIAASNLPLAARIAAPPLETVSITGILHAALREYPTALYAVIDYWGGRVYLTDSQTVIENLQAALPSAPSIELKPDGGQSSAALTWFAQNANAWEGTPENLIVEPRKPKMTASAVVSAMLPAIAQSTGRLGIAVLDQANAKLTFLAPTDSAETRDAQSEALAAVAMDQGRSVAIDLDEKGQSLFVQPEPPGDNLPDGVAAAFHLDEASGSRESYVGNFTLADSGETFSQAGKWGQAATANGSGQLVGSNGAFDIGNGFTIHGWLYLNGGSEYRPVFSVSGYGGFTLRIGSDDVLVAYMFDDQGAWNALYAAAPFPVEVWTRVCVTWDAASTVLSLYVADWAGVPTMQTTMNANRADWALRLLGESGWNASGLALDEVVCWPRCLTAEEVAAMLNYAPQP